MLPQLVRGDRSLAQKALAVVMEAPLSAYQSEQIRIGTAQTIAFGLRDPELCVAALGQDLREPAWSRELLEARSSCLQLARHPNFARAEADLRRYISNTPGRVEDGVELPANGKRQSRTSP
jgi:hypothetical protein